VPTVGQVEDTKEKEKKREETRVPVGGIPLGGVPLPSTAEQHTPPGPLRNPRQTWRNITQLAENELARNKARDRQDFESFLGISTLTERQVAYGMLMDFLSFQNFVSVVLMSKKASARLSKEVRGVETKSPAMVEAAKKELQSWVDFAAYTRVKWVKGMPLVGSRFIYTWKTVAEGGVKRAKGRLCALGFQDPYLDELRCEAPTAGKQSWRLVVATCACRGWAPRNLDVKTAFLQGEPIERELYLRPPPEAGEEKGIVWRLLKSVYGLVDSPER
jgi:hypothetical protein